jgi:hypothetical protein
LLLSSKKGSNLNGHEIGLSGVHSKNLYDGKELLNRTHISFVHV